MILFANWCDLNFGIELSLYIPTALLKLGIGCFLSLQTLKFCEILFIDNSVRFQCFILSALVVASLRVECLIS